MAADSPRSPLGREARALSDEAWSRARAHELTEEQLQETIARVRALATREQEQEEREGIESEARVLRDLFRLVEYEERDADLERIRDSDIVRRAEEIAAQAAPIVTPDIESPEERAERRDRIHRALVEVSQLFSQATSEQRQILQDLVDTLRWARDSIDGTAAPT